MELIDKDKLKAHYSWWESQDADLREQKRIFDDIVDLQPIVEDRPIRCKDCKYYREDLWVDIYGVPVIAAHQVCIKWGYGCKTIENGYCHFGEPRGEE